MEQPLSDQTGQGNEAKVVSSIDWDDPIIPKKSDQIANRYALAKEAFDDQLKADFPDFTVEEYSELKAAEEGIDRESLPSKVWSTARSFPERLDLTGDGKVGLDDAKLAGKKVAGRVQKTWQTASSVSKDDVVDAAATVGGAAFAAGKKVVGFDYVGSVKRAGSKAKDSVQSVNADTFKSGGSAILRIGKTATGIQGLQNRKKAAQIKETSGEYVQAAEELTELRRVELNRLVEEFGAQRLEALQATLGRFLQILEELKQSNREKEYEVLDELGIDTQTLEAMGTLDMTVKQSLAATAASGTLAMVAPHW